MANRYKKTSGLAKETGGYVHKVIREVTATYVFLILTLYPLYYQNKYYNMGDAKWIFFRNVTGVFMGVVITLYCIYMCILANKGEIRSYLEGIKLSYLDKFVLGYFIAVLISVLLSPNKDAIIWGYDGWYMGLIAQTCFVLIYFFVSRYWRYDQSAIVIYLTTAMIVFFLAIIMRFNIDPMEMYKDLDESYKILFLTTIGQATWYSSYMCIIFPIGMFAFWHSDKKWARIFGGIFTSLGFMTMVTQNSDSAFIAFGVIFVAMFWISVESNKRFERFLEVMLLGLASYRVMGIFQILFPDQAVDLDTLPTFTCQSLAMLLLLIAVALAYVGFRYLEKNRKEFDISKYRVIRVAVLVLILLALLAGVIYIALNTTGKLPESMRSTNNYLMFNEFWGNNRGSSWMISVGTFIQSGWLRKLFGAGPDGFASSVYQFYGDVLNKKWGENTILTCGHNEWLTAIINMGLVGGLLYLGIFVSAIKRFFAKSKEYPELIAIAISILSYMGHNFFCYQQIICTPTIFILIGAGECIIRNGKVRD